MIRHFYSVFIFSALLLLSGCGQISPSPISENDQSEINGTSAPQSILDDRGFKTRVTTKHPCGGLAGNYTISCTNGAVTAPHPLFVLEVNGVCQVQGDLFNPTTVQVVSGSVNIDFTTQSQNGTFHVVIGGTKRSNSSYVDWQSSIFGSVHCTKI